MKKRDYILTAILLLMIGLTGGTLIALYQLNPELAPLSDVQVTEIKRDSTPNVENDVLEEMDTRFLFRKIADSVTPTVVYIETTIPIDGEPEAEVDDESVWDRIMPRRVRTVGSGIMLSSNGYILTNNHVIEGAVKNGLRVVLNDKREFPAKIAGYDSSTDLAVIKIPGNNYNAITVGDSDLVEVGEWVLAIGNPFRLRSTVTAGIVSALGRDVQIINDRMRIESFIQTDAAINRGNSGGALVNTSGQLIGVNTAIASQTGNYQGYGFAVPSNLALKVAGDLIEYGYVRRPILGVTIAAVDYERALNLGMEKVTGVEILNVTDNGAADEAGIRSGDVILAVNGEEVAESNELQQKVAIRNPGEKVKLRIFRNGNTFDREVTLDMLPVEENILADNTSEPEESNEMFEPDNEIQGVFKSDLGFSVVREIENGEDIFRVFEVETYSEAWNRGLQEGDLILQAGKEKFDHLNGLKDLISQNLNRQGHIILEYSRDDAKGFVKLQN